MILGGYSFGTWLMFFYIYCFIGWCIESTYVSVFCEHRWVNRGFLFGPMLPIYGSGALTILLSTLPVRDNILLTGLVGMLTATALEYLTGVVMEAIFKVRYWDYSKHRFNLQGHICLSSSLSWGVLSVLLVYVVHKPVEELVSMIDPQVRKIALMAISVLFIVDVTRSISAALDLKHLLAWLDDARGEMKKMQARMEEIEAQLAKEIRQRGEQLQESVKAHQEQLADGYQLKREQLQQELNNLKAHQELLKEWTAQRFGPDKRGLLRRNPGALSRHYKEALERLRDWQKR